MIRPQPSSTLSLYQQQATKLLSRKSVILGIPIAAGSIILFLQWRKRKSLKPKPKPKKESDNSRSTATNGKPTSPSSETPSASAQNGSAMPSAAAPDYTDDAPPSYADVTKAPPQHNPAAAPAASPTRSKHTQAEDDVVPGQFAYAKRPRLGRGRSSEKFQSYAPLIRRTSAEKKEDEEKTRIKEEEDAAAAAAVAAFSPEPAAAAEPSLSHIAVAAAEEKSEDVAPDSAPPASSEEEPAEEPASWAAVAAASPPPPLHNPFAVQVNGWHHDDEEPEMPVRDFRRPSIIATFEIEHSSEPAGLSPGGLHDEYSRRPSVVTTISAEPAIEEGNEDDDFEWTPESRRESATIETTISVGEDAFSGPADGPATGVSTTISGPLSTVVDDEDDEFAPETPIDPPSPADLDAPPFTPSQDMPPAEVALQKALDAGMRDGEAASRTNGPLSSKPVLVAAATGVPAPQAAVVEEVMDMVSEYERAPLAHLPGMGVPNRA